MTQPTPDDIRIADYVRGFRAGCAAGGIQYDYEHRATSSGHQHVMAVLARDGFLAGNAPVLEVATGASPHVGWNLYSRLDNRDVSFMDSDADALAIHRDAYLRVRHDTDHGLRDVRAYWLLGDAQEDSYALKDKTVIMHGTVPRVRKYEDLLVPDTTDKMTRTLYGLLAAGPERLAIYLYRDDPDQCACFDRAAHVLPALDQLGVQYRRYDNVESADFQPQPGGTLVLMTP